MGLTYKGGASYYHSISENISRVTKYYNSSTGYFGTKGTNNRVRIITSDNPARTGKEFYDNIAYGGKQEALKNSTGGYKTSLEDGTIITFRPSTKSDSNPGVEINITKSTNSGGLKRQKIHFEEE